MATITRKIQIFINEDDAEKRKALYQKWRENNRVCYRAANMVSSNFYIQKHLADLAYYTEEVKVKLTNIAKDPAGVFTMSRDNTTYQLLSKYFKGEAPMGMMSGLNMLVSKNAKADEKDVAFGKRALRTYKETIPMPVRSADMSRIEKQEDGNYTFFVYGTPFKTNFGRDLSGNEIIMDKAVQGEYKLCDSSIQFKNNKMFFLAVFSFESEKIKVDAEKQAICRLSPEYPIIILEKKDKFFAIGNKEEFLYQRLAIKGALSRLQKAAKYNVGGKGRAKKMEAIERFEEKERNYVQTKLHLYSKMLIDYCVKRGIGTIVLTNYKEAEESTHEGTDESNFLLSSWSYYGLSEKIKYKAKRLGIEVVLE